MTSIRYSPGFQAFVIEAGDLQTKFDDSPKGTADMLAWLRRRALRQATAEGNPEGLTTEELDRLKADWLAQGGEVKGKIKRLNLKELGL